MKTFKELLSKEHLNACEEAVDLTGDKSVEQAIKECPRGDWLLWLAKELELDERKRYLAAGHCINTVRHLMEDKRSRDAVDGAIAYGKGEISLEELEKLRCAYAAYAAYVADAATYAAYAATTFAAAAFAAAATCSADAAFAAACSASAARKENQKQTADICREHLGQLIIDKVNQLTHHNK